MLDIELEFYSEIQIFVSSTDISVSRMGDVILLEKDTEEFKPRNPWNYLCTAYNYKILSGKSISEEKFITDNNIILESNKYKLFDIVNLIDGVEFTMAMIQKDKLYLCKYCRLDGSEIDTSMLLSIEVQKTELIKDK